MQRQKTKFTGVYVRRSGERRFNGKPDECYDITFKLPSGSKKWEKIGWKSEGYTANMASQIRAERLRAMRHGDMSSVRRKSQELTFGEAWTLYFTEHLKPKSDPESTKKHPDESRYDTHLAPRFKDMPLSAITPLDLERMKNDMFRAGLAPQTCEHALGQVRRVYRKMIAWDKWFGKIPTEKVEVPQFDNKRHRWLTPAETGRLLDALRGRSERTYQISMISLHTGMRAGEIFALKGQDVMLESGEIHVLHSRKHSDGRTVYMTPSLHKVMEALTLRSGDLVFASRKGTRLPHIGGTFKKIVNELGLNDGVNDPRARVVFHTLRHTFGSWLAQAGVPLYSIGELMGHSQEETTRRYAHLCPNRQRQSANIIEAIFNGEEVNAAHTSSPAETADTLRRLFGGSE
ncbi:site-specific integrase [Desulfobaculum senezii]